LATVHRWPRARGEFAIPNLPAVVVTGVVAAVSRVPLAARADNPLEPLGESSPIAAADGSSFRDDFMAPSRICQQALAVACFCKTLTSAQTLPLLPIRTVLPDVSFMTKKSKVVILPLPMLEKTLTVGSRD
jgi:hypothetical protein